MLNDQREWDPRRDREADPPNHIENIPSGRIQPDHGPYGSEHMRSPQLFAPTALEEVSRSILDHLVDGVYVADTNGRILDANPAMLAMLGAPSVTELNGRPFQWFLTELPTQGGPDSPEGVFGLRAIDGTSHSIHHSRLAIRTGLNEDRIVGIVRVIRGVINESMLHHQRLSHLGTLSVRVIHDINNLLLAILGHSDWLTEAGALDAESQSRVDHVRQAGARAAELATHLLAYSGPSRKDRTVTEVDVTGLVDETMKLFEAVIQRNASITYELDPALPTVSGDPMQLRRVIMNLVLNAADALGDRPGQITIATQEARPDAEWPAPGATGTTPARVYVCLEVRDTGCGMDENTKQRIFEPFFTSKDKGLGLGLATVAEIVKSHKGSVSVTSVLHEGTTFRVFLPASGIDESAQPLEM